ncbi:MAG: serine--tRNA ligase [Alphaproteobacteria bacterium]
MLDIRWIRDEPAAFDEALRRRGMEPASEAVLAVDRDRRAAQTRFQELQQRRNDVSRRVGQAKARGEDAAALIDEVARLKDDVQAAEEAERAFGRRLDEMLAAFPNPPAEDVPAGSDESANVELRRVGEPRRFDFAPLDHVAIGERLGMMDFARASKLSGARFVVLSGPLARLERALAAFMLDIHTREFGYVEVAPPLLVRDEALYGTGQLPKFSDDLFRTGEGFWLVPTAEVPLTNLVAGEILDEAVLPMRFTAATPCFRSEAGSAGRDTRGMIRQHQFLKVELVSVTTPDASDMEQERMTEAAETVLRRLELPYRVVSLCSGDIGFAARRTFDIEVWLPGQGAYREISSCSTCGDFQARRMNARSRRKGEKGTQFVHTLNGSGLAVGRTMVALLENGQQADGTVVLPKALRPYLGGTERIGGDA